ncbi:hypothetical protein ONS95_012039 [Cadophora gregata]|uniref:uncharacterized protein n=1 Tax=Cadophora gregata TaxID=51156 RepID=UPI0026DCCCA5|nr:uncharacterized protein ONS95_012039 [Cadophora gregata]KAK0117710.1 hypothetical protein ONS95_012039 [Cadophora gregata]KAK0122760.1 hypothetical protein ONS96_009795 [Cadophora gregata f. sp. sojae]
MSMPNRRALLDVYYGHDLCLSSSHSDVIISQGKKSKKDKDTDSESVSSSSPSSADTVVVPPPGPKKCPLRFIMTGMFEIDGDAESTKPKGCPLRRVQLWHTIPLVLLAIINLILVIVALLGLAGYRIAVGIQDFVVGLAKSDLDNPYAESPADSDQATLVSEKQ